MIAPKGSNPNAEVAEAQNALSSLGCLVDDVRIEKGFNLLLFSLSSLPLPSKRLGLILNDLLYWLTSRLKRPKRPTSSRDRPEIRIDANQGKASTPQRD